MRGDVFTGKINSFEIYILSKLRSSTFTNKLSLMEGNIDTFRMLKVKRRGLYPAPDDSIQFSIRVIFSPIFTRNDTKFQLPVD